MSARRSLKVQPSGAERGAALVEFALIAPVLVLLALGVLEIGNAWRQGTGLERAAAQGARTVSSQGDGRFADYEALRAIDSATRTLSGIEVTRVVIFNATGRATGDVPPQCLTASRSNLCNTYTGEQVRTVSPAGFSGGSLAAPSCAGSWDALWCPLSRNREANPPLRIGVHITAEYTPVTGLFPGPTFEMQRTAVFQIEPCARGDLNC